MLTCKIGISATDLANHLMQRPSPGPDARRESVLVDRGQKQMPILMLCYHILGPSALTRPTKRRAQDIELSWSLRSFYVFLQLREA